MRLRQQTPPGRQDVIRLPEFNNTYIYIVHIRRELMNAAANIIIHLIEDSGSEIDNSHGLRDGGRLLR